MDEFEKRRLDHFPQLETECYLDHAGATLYSVPQMNAMMQDFQQNLYGNPHSQSLSSHRTSEKIDFMRTKILHHFHTTHNEYHIIFTSGCTAGLKIIAETFQFHNNGGFAFLVTSHTSVVGMRELARERGASVWPFQESDVLQANEKESGDGNVSGTHGDTMQIEGNLLVFPGMCNFTGRKYPLAWISRAQQGRLLNLQTNVQGRWFVLLDAASLVATSSLDLDLTKPDFVTMSFYKMFGYPTGLGALLVHKRAASVLKKHYFGGGTVDVVLPDGEFYKPRKSLSAHFEDGTLPFLDIIALAHGFQAFQSFWSDMDQLSDHVFNLAQRLVRELSSLRHSNGAPLVQVYRATEYTSSITQGGIVTFNVLADDGDYIGYSKIARIAELNGIHLRTGCFCNIGACQKMLGLSNMDVVSNWSSGHVCGDGLDIINGLPTGAVRVSFGYMSHTADIDRLVEMLRDFFLVTVSSFVSLSITSLDSGLDRANRGTMNLSELERMSVRDLTARYCVDASEFSEEVNQKLLSTKSSVTNELLFMSLYPVKACGGQLVREWPLSRTGLLFDRSFVVVREDGKALGQKHEPKLCQIRAFVDLQLGVLILASELSSQYNMIIEFEATRTAGLGRKFAPLCGSQVEVVDCGDAVARWLDDALGREGCRLWWQQTDRDSPLDCSNDPLSLASESQFLVVNLSSVKWLRDQMPEPDNDLDLSELCTRFRPNLIVALEEPFLEERMTHMTVSNDVRLKALESCNRCQVICIDQQTGKRGSQEPLRTLTRMRPKKTAFGMYCVTEKDECHHILKCPFPLLLEK